MADAEKGHWDQTDSMVGIQETVVELRQMLRRGRKILEEILIVQRQQREIVLLHIRLIKLKGRETNDKHLITTKQDTSSLQFFYVPEYREAGYP
jgi:hypothetical protein